MPSKSRPARHNRITAQQVAESAGVSLSAVSRTFTAGASVSPLTRGKVLEAAKALGYQPNAMARSLMTGRTELIGLASNNFDNPAFMEIFDRFTRGLQDRGFRPLLANLSASSGPEAAIAMLKQYHVDGVIVASSTVSPDFISGCINAEIPLVHAFGKAVARPRFHVVGADNFQGGRIAARVLLDHGYRRIAFLGGPSIASSTADRLRGFQSCLLESGIKPVVEYFASRYAHDEGRDTMLRLLNGPPVEAVFCGDDILAMGAIDACRARGLSVPGNIGILGFNDIAMASWAGYDLSTIRQPIADIIKAAVDVVIRLVEGEKVAKGAAQFSCEPVLRGTLR